MFEFHSVCRTTCELDYSGLHEKFFLDPQVLGYFGNLGALVQVMKVLGMRYHHDEHCKVPGCDGLAKLQLF